MLRMRLGIGVLLAASLLLVLALVPTGGASPDRPNAPTGRKLSGKRLVGKTSQQKRLCFTLTSDGKRLREYAYDYRNTCGGGNLRSTFRGGLPLAANGTFSSGSAGSFFKGRISGTKTTGTTRSKQQTFILGTLETCDTGLVRWSARQASG